MKPVIAVSGKNGQLGWELGRLAGHFPMYEFICCDRNELDITDEEQLKIFFQKYKPAVFINCAAYTAVDKAETEQEAAFKVNAAAVGFLAEQCSVHDTVFITFSTDYVFNGNGNIPYKEDDPSAPVNFYGGTKRKGEQLALENWEKTVIIRTSWVYSVHGHNFLKTMLRLMSERSDINVVNDQLGSPANARDLAEAVMAIIGKILISEQKPEPYGIYHFSNEGIISWFDFASAIQSLSRADCRVHPITSSAFPTPAKRPAYSVLNKQKITSVFGISLEYWKTSLAACIEEINKKSGSKEPLSR